MKDLRKTQKTLVMLACSAIACGLGWALVSGHEHSPLTILFFGAGLSVLASVARSVSKEQELSEKKALLQISKI
jgi:hypothetical protein